LGLEEGPTIKRKFWSQKPRKTIKVYPMQMVWILPFRDDEQEIANSEEGGWEMEDSEGSESAWVDRREM